MEQKELLPVHIGIIMDGNGRWAKKRGLPRKMGHRAGAEAFKNIARYANKRGIRFMTMYVFSTENWKRPQDEVNSIVELLRNYLDEVERYKDENIRLRFIGNLSVFDEDIRQKMERAEKNSAENTGLTLNLAINYGGRDEIVHAARRLAQKAKDGQLQPEEITEELFSQNLYAGDEPDVDLIIRPSGEYRLSNFLIWQSAYAEYVFMDEVLWPDFKPSHFEEALREFQKRNRRFGGI
ncbi:MAG TPA: isoprenyl transferase [Candidatus Merdivicinus excrementipullorum]|uniref:Isoprenyl transferase n=1 Tax=Candidatus Merdivicinus excrementipullorum TaxID=2840867 RepID=A0A9D1JZF6_9FIRM|nr:isoprenyl transferase [Candidatus Merdivicinus excrementipullorum]